MGIFFQIVLVAIILSGMIIILLGIDQLITGRFNADEESAKDLRRDVELKDDVITDNNVFRDLVHCKRPENRQQKQ